MNIESFRSYCLTKPGVTEEFPFDDTTLVFKVMGKMFAATGLDEQTFEVNLKCDPERAIELREQYNEIRPGFHMNKEHWNTIDFGGTIPQTMLTELIDDSYNLVVRNMTKKMREELKKQT